MGKCVMCGKKGLFLRVNACGRCKKCENKFKREEEEKLKREQEDCLKKEKELEEKKQEAKSILFEISDLYMELENHRIHNIEVFNKADFDFEHKRCNDTYNKYNELLEQSKTTEFFDDLLLEYIKSRKEEFKNKYNDLYLNLSGYFNIASLVYSSTKDIFNDIITNLWSDGFSFHRDWKKNIVLTEENKSEQKSDDEFKINTERYNSFDDISKTIFDTIPDCVITDIETSGLIYNRNSIIEIAAIKILDGKVSDIYSSLIHRDKPLDSKIVSLTGITTQMLRECNKDLDTVMSEYREFVGRLPLVGHNIKSFDIKFINEAYVKVFGVEIENQCIDTLKMSYEYFYDVESHKLGDLARFAKIPVGTAHRALGDCETTAYLYKYMVDSTAFCFLRWCKNGKSIDETDGIYPKYLTRRYPDGICHEYHKKLIETGYLERADISDNLNTLKISDLKDMLAQNSLSCTGTKAILINRIIQNVNIQSLNISIKYVLSQKGLEYFEQLIAMKNSEYLRNIKDKNYGLARNVIYDISEIYKDIGNMKEYYFYLLCTFYHDMSGLNNDGYKEERNELMFAPKIILALKKKSKYYEESMIDRCFHQYLLPDHYFSAPEFSAIMKKLFYEGIMEMQEMVINS